MFLPGLIVSSAPTPIFHDVASEAGLTFHHFTGATGQFFMPEIMGSGAALLDYDDDGDFDVFLVQGIPFEPGKTPRFHLRPGRSPGTGCSATCSRETGRLTFVDVTEQAGLRSHGYGMGAATGDYDNDGFPDLYVTNFGGNVLYHNNGNGTFTDATSEPVSTMAAGARAPPSSTTTGMGIRTSSLRTTSTSPFKATELLRTDGPARLLHPDCLQSPSPPACSRTWGTADSSM